LVCGCYPQMPEVFAFLQLPTILHSQTVGLPLRMGLGAVLSTHLVGLLLSYFLRVMGLGKFWDGHRTLLITTIEVLESLVLTLLTPFGVVAVRLHHCRVP